MQQSISTNSPKKSQRKCSKLLETIVERASKKSLKKVFLHSYTMTHYSSQLTTSKCLKKSSIKIKIPNKKHSHKYYIEIERVVLH